MRLFFEAQKQRLHKILNNTAQNSSIHTLHDGAAATTAQSSTATSSNTFETILPVGPRSFRVGFGNLTIMGGL